MISSPFPKLSVIVPVYRQWDGMAGLLHALAASAPAANPPELIVVSNEALPDDLDTASWPLDVRLETCFTPGSYAARNVGAALAKGTHLVFTDADCRPAPDFLTKVAEAVTRHPDDILAGRIVVETDPPPTIWSDYDEVRGIPQDRYAGRGYGACANLTVPHSVLDHAGGFDPERLSGGDAEFCRRADATVRYVPEAVVAHPARRTAAEVLTKARRIRGGQVCAGPFKRRLMWVFASFLPPFREIRRFAGAKVPIAKKFRALAVLLLVWLVSLGETIRLLLGGQAERR